MQRKPSQRQRRNPPVPIDGLHMVVTEIREIFPHTVQRRVWDLGISESPWVAIRHHRRELLVDFFARNFHDPSDIWLDNAREVRFVGRFAPVLLKKLGQSSPVGHAKRIQPSK